MRWPIYLFVPNLIGYARIVCNVWAFAICFQSKLQFVGLYFFSFFLDYLDGRAAVLFNQKSTFGAILDMVTDRMSTASLLLLLSHAFPDWFRLAAALLVLDISSHWLQMYSSFLESKVSHKHVKDTEVWLLRLYYRSRPFMAYCCIGAEVLYLSLFLYEDKFFLIPSVGLPYLGEVPLLILAAWIAFPGFCLKQVINVVQMVSAAHVCVLYDLKQKQSKEQ